MATCTVSADFLRHARCNRKVTMDETKCAPAYRRTLELAKTVSQTQDVDRGLRRSCCAFSEFVECKSFHVSRDCGDRASEFFARHMERISGPLIEDHCGPYAHGACVSAATDAATPATMRGSYGTFSTILLVLTSAVYTAGYPCPKNSWGSWP
ncbi:unnamed protein product [Ixodes pacificus]